MIWVVLHCFSLIHINCVTAGDVIVLELDVVYLRGRGWSALSEPEVFEKEVTEAHRLSSSRVVSCLWLVK